MSILVSCSYVLDFDIVDIVVIQSIRDVEALRQQERLREAVQLERDWKYQTLDRMQKLFIRRAEDCYGTQNSLPRQPRPPRPPHRPPQLEEYYQPPDSQYSGGLEEEEDDLPQVSPSKRQRKTEEY